MNAVAFPPFKGEKKRRKEKYYVYGNSINSQITMLSIGIVCKKNMKSIYCKVSFFKSLKYSSNLQET
jgi:hypothetical protein